MTSEAKPALLRPHLPDDVTVRHWVAAYAVYFAAMAVPLGLLLAAGGASWGDWTDRTAETFRGSTTAAKLLGMALYLSLCCTFLPLPAMWVVSAVAAEPFAVTGNVWTTTLVVAGVGAMASTMANLNDYHIFTWMLRHRRIAALRHTRTYQQAVRWFSRAPFLLLVLFNLIPIPVDVVRMLAVTYRYPRASFAAANYLGRFVRYAVIAFVTYELAGYGWVATLVLLGFAVAMGLGRLGLSLLRRVRKPRPAGEEAAANLPTRES